jgi:hypothetical protein
MRNFIISLMPFVNITQRPLYLFSVRAAVKSVKSGADGRWSYTCERLCDVR